MALKNSIVIVFLFIVFAGLGQDKLIYLQNEIIKAGFLPDVGGRMVYLSPVGSENFLLSDSLLWNEPQSERIVPEPNSPFKPYNGFITWVGPQSGWWKQQNLLPEKRERGDMWPPDPYLIYSNFKVVEHTNHLLVMEGPESPVSGIKLVKRYELIGSSISIEVSATNIRNEAVAWDLWSNARFGAFTLFRVPVEEPGLVKIKSEENSKFEIVQHQFEDGNFSFLPEYPSNEKKNRISKAFIYPAKGEMMVSKGAWNLTINFDLVPLEAIHPEQGMVEVYNCVSFNKPSCILELEHHSAYKTLRTGEQMSLKEVWTFGIARQEY